MGTHVHLLIKEETEALGKIMKRIGVRYVYWYNRKYERSGHLFQDRYKSEPVDDDGYFMTVLRYIHQNPRKSGLC
jgi:REP element-mobilizing transposase RayT